MKNLKNILKNTAKINNSTLKDVKKEISLAIDLAMKNPLKSPEADAFWKGLTKSKRQPTPEEVIAAVYEKISNLKNSP